MSEDSKDTSPIVLPEDWDSNKKAPPVVPFEQWKSNLPENQVLNTDWIPTPSDESWMTTEDIYTPDPDWLNEQKPIEEMTTYLQEVFEGYPQKTVDDITGFFHSYRAVWEKVKAGSASDGDISTLRNGNVLEITSIPRSGDTFIPRPLTHEEIPAFAEVTALFSKYRRSKTFGEGYTDTNSRFYLQVADGEPAAKMMSNLVTELHALKDEGRIPSWEIKSEGVNENRYLRFSPAYIDKGGVVLYSADEALGLFQERLLTLYQEFPQAFSSIHLPFQYEPPNTPNGAWSVAMQADSILNVSTPEQGMLTVKQQFITELGLNKQWLDLDKIDGERIREVWETACQQPYIRRSPQEPWITTDRPRPGFFK